MAEIIKPLQEVFWFAARVHFGQEIKIKLTLEKMGVECFIPTEPRANYRGQVKQHPLIPALVFIHSTKKQATDLKVLYHLPVNYIFDAAAHRMMIVPDKQMEDFQRVLDMSLKNGGLVEMNVEPGASVVVTKGPLRGVEGSVSQVKGKYYVVVSLLGSVFTKAQVPLAYLELKKD